MDPDPLTIVREALTQPVPCPSCGSTRPCRCITDHDTSGVLAERVIERLAAAGLLHTEAPRQATQADIDAAARWLAEQSGSPRYAGDLWRRLLESEANVIHAHGAAVRANQPAVGQHVSDLAAAKSLLCTWHKRQADIRARRAEQG